jgi:hypothetical protein
VAPVRVPAGCVDRWRSGFVVGVMAAVLANILPGIREIRAPLVAGYLWLATGWILIGGPTSAASASGLGRALSALARVGGRGGVLAALSLGAYLVGVLSVAVTNAIVAFADRVTARRAHDLLDPARSDYIGLLNDLARIPASIRDGEGYVVLPVALDDAAVTIYRPDRTVYRQTLKGLRPSIDAFQSMLRDLPNPLNVTHVLGQPALSAFRDAFRQAVGGVPHAPHPDGPVRRRRVRARGAPTMTS